MGILMTVWALFGVGITAGFAGAVAKEGVSKILDKEDSTPPDMTKIKRFLVMISIFLIVYLCLNAIMLIPVALGLCKGYQDLRETIILVDLLLAGLITCWLVKFRLKDYFE